MVCKSNAGPSIDRRTRVLAAGKSFRVSAFPEVDGSRHSCEAPWRRKSSLQKLRALAMTKALLLWLAVAVTLGPEPQRVSVSNLRPVCGSCGAQSCDTEGNCEDRSCKVVDLSGGDI